MAECDDQGVQYKHEIVHVQDKWAEVLPDRIPLRYAFFRYLGFCFKVNGISGNTSAKALKPGSRAALRIRITTSKGVVLDEKIPGHFTDGVYYVQDIVLQEEGLHTFQVWIDSRVYTSVKPFVHELHVHQFMRLHDDPRTLFGGPYGSLRKTVDPYLFGTNEEVLEVDWNDELIDECLVQSKSKLRPIDSKWWLRQFVEQGVLQEKKQHQLRHGSNDNNAASNSRSRKQAHPIRSGDKRDHDSYFQGRQKDIKRQRTKQIRIFSHEPLHVLKYFHQSYSPKFEFYFEQFKENHMTRMQGSRDGSIFGSVSFTCEEQQRTDAYLRQKLNSNLLSRRPGPGGRRLTYLESCKAIEIANEAFGFNGWSCRIVDCNIECKEKSDDGRWYIIYSTVVRIELKDGTCHEDVGFGQSEGMRDLGAALEQAKKASISDGRKRALRLFGEYLGNSCYDKEHIKDVAANRANHATLQSPTSIKLENAQTTSVPPLHPTNAIENNQVSGNAPNFEPPPRNTAKPNPGIVQNPRLATTLQSAQPNATIPVRSDADSRVVSTLNQPAERSNGKAVMPRPQIPPSLIKPEPPKSIEPSPVASYRPNQMPIPKNLQRGQPTPVVSNYGSRPPNMPSTTFVRPAAVNMSPSMNFQPDHSDSNRKRTLTPYNDAMEDLDGLRLSQFEFDDQHDTKRSKK